MDDIYAWGHKLPLSDVGLKSLAELESLILSSHPAEHAEVRGIVDDFEKEAHALEKANGGAALMRPVNERTVRDYRRNTSFLLGLAAFLIVVLPVVSFAHTFGRYQTDFEQTLTVPTVLLAVTAALCLLKAATTLTDRVWAGIMVHWAVVGAVMSCITAVALTWVASLVPSVTATSRLNIIYVSTAVVAAFAVHAVVRDLRAKSLLRTDLEATSGRVRAYTLEFQHAYDTALGSIRSVLGTLDAQVLADMKFKRDAVLAHLAHRKGLYDARAPARLNKREFGEMLMLAVAEPLRGAGPYPSMSRAARE